VWLDTSSKCPTYFTAWCLPTNVVLSVESTASHDIRSKFVTKVVFFFNNILWFWHNFQVFLTDFDYKMELCLASDWRKNATTSHCWNDAILNFSFRYCFNRFELVYFWVNTTYSYFIKSLWNIIWYCRPWHFRESWIFFTNKYVKFCFFLCEIGWSLKVVSS